MINATSVTAYSTPWSSSHKKRRVCYFKTVDQCHMEDTEAALFLLNPVAETARDAVDKLGAEDQ